MRSPCGTAVQSCCKALVVVVGALHQGPAHTGRWRPRGLFHWASILGSGGVGPRIGSTLFHWGAD
eukprot:293215-Chlamydomonas_euryale.AAC.1